MEVDVRGNAKDFVCEGFVLSQGFLQLSYYIPRDATEINASQAVMKIQSTMSTATHPLLLLIKHHYIIIVAVC